MKIELTEQEINLIGVALGRMPYGDVAQLIANIQKQINEQNEPKRTEPEAVE